MDITQEQLLAHTDAFKEIVNSGAFVLLEQHFQNSFLQGNSAQLDTTRIAEAYLFESGAMRVFRTFRDLATNLQDPIDEALEKEVLEDDALSLLD